MRGGARAGASPIAGQPAHRDRRHRARDPDRRTERRAAFAGIAEAVRSFWTVDAEPLYCAKALSSAAEPGSHT